MATYDWINGLPVQTDSTNIDWVGGLPYIIYEAAASGTQHSITGTAAGSSSLSATARLYRWLKGTFTAASNITTVLVARRRIAGMVEVTSTIVNSILVNRKLSAALTAVSDVSAILRASYKAQATLTAVSNLELDIKRLKTLKALSTAISSLSAELSIKHKLNLEARIDAISNLSMLIRGGSCVGKFHITNNALQSVEGADSGTYQIENNSADVKVSGVSIPVMPFHKPYFDSYTNGVLTLNIMLAA